MNPQILRVLIVEDGAKRQETLRQLVREHAWVVAHTAERAIRLVRAFEFDLVFLDFDLAGVAKGDRVAAALLESRSRCAKVVVHSMNARGAESIAIHLPDAVRVPLSRITRDNATFKRLRQELRNGVDVEWASMLRRRSGRETGG